MELIFPRLTNLETKIYYSSDEELSALVSEIAKKISHSYAKCLTAQGFIDRNPKSAFQAVQKNLCKSMHDRFCTGTSGEQRL
jgi:hypothetical protein